MTAVTRGETAIGSTVLHGVINEIVRGFPVEPVLPCEGVGYEVGSVAIIKGARNLEAARKFVDWSLSPEGQKIGLDVKEYAIPTNRSVRAAAAGAADHRRSKSSTTTSRNTARRRTRKRLLERWEKEINSAPR